MPCNLFWGGVVHVINSEIPHFRLAGSDFTLGAERMMHPIGLGFSHAWTSAHGLVYCGRLNEWQGGTKSRKTGYTSRCSGDPRRNHSLIPSRVVARSRLPFLHPKRFRAPGPDQTGYGYSCMERWRRGDGGRFLFLVGPERAGFCTRCPRIMSTLVFSMACANSGNGRSAPVVVAYQKLRPIGQRGHPGL